MPTSSRTNCALSLVAAILALSTTATAQDSPSIESPSKEPAFRVGRLSLTERLLQQADGDTVDDLVPAKGLVQERYENGQVRLERGVAQDEEGNFVNHGIWRTYDMQGRPAMTGEYDQGKMNGDWVRWYHQQPAFMGKDDSGFQLPFVSAASFKSGQLNGVWVVTDAKDRQLFQIELTNGRRNGLATFYHSNGEKAREFTYRDGQLVGASSQWDSKGQKVKESTYVSGREMTSRVVRAKGSSQGRIMEELNLLGPKAEIVQYDDWTNGKLAVYNADGEPIRHGECRKYHSNGQVSHEGSYEEGVEVGRHIWWYSSGQIATQGSFVNGKRNGAWIWNYENGLPKVVGKYRNGERDGTWRSWSPDGKVQNSNVQVPDLISKRPSALSRQ